MLKPHSIIDQMLFLIWFQGHAKIRKKNKVLHVAARERENTKDEGGVTENDLISLLDPNGQLC